MPQRIPPEVAAQVARLFAEEAQAIFRSAVRAAQGDRGGAEDCVQAAFQAAAEKWGTIASYSPERKRAWLRRVAINKAIDAYRAGERVRSAGDPGEMGGGLPRAEHIALTRMQAERCMQAIGEMPDIRRKVAYLKFHEEWKNWMIADHLGISRGTVGKHVSDARADLKKALPEMSFTGHPDEEADADGEEAR
jgi:RNA polymerase sigma factor (sigma-70 family)